MPSSFKRTTGFVPTRYRTPSPPRYAFEPISPVLTAIAEHESRRADTTSHRNGGLKRPYSLYEHIDFDVREHKYLPGGSMDAFASIALATNSSGRHQPSTSTGAQFISDGCHDTDRPSKRAKSEKPPLSDWRMTTLDANTRPVMSDEQSPESRRLEAELLLNFAHEAAKLVCSPQEFFQINTQLSSNVSRPSPSIQIGLTVQSPEDSGRGLTEAGAWNSAGVTKKAEVQTIVHEERAIDKKRPRSEANPRQELDLDQLLSDGPAGELLHTSVGQSEIEGEQLSHAAITKQTYIDIPPEVCEKDAGNITIETFGRSEVEEHTRNSGDFVNHDPQNVMEIDSQIYGSGADVKNESHNSVSSDERFISNDFVQEDAMQPTGEDLQALEDAVQASELREGVISARIKGSDIVHTLEEHQGKTKDDASRTTHSSSGKLAGVMNDKLAAEAENIKQSTPEFNAIQISASEVSVLEGQPRPAVATAAICASCKFGRNSPAIENDNDATSWISCDGCKSWFHFACAGFKNDREVRSVDKYRCRKCKPLYGATTYVRKSSRAHSAIDYAGLHQGVIKTSDERPEHHYIKPIKDGTITFLPESFARMRPELVTTEYFEKGTGMREPIVIPASFNPRPKTNETLDTSATRPADDAPLLNPLEDNQIVEDWFSRHMDPEAVSDQGQDALDMVIPQGLTVRRVAELYGPDEKVEVIDVKSQNGENKKWNMRRWADYYENANNKVVRNVISLEVSQSKLGRLIRRPRIVRDLDLQDSVWPEELLAKGEYPRVQFYCLMSVADCFTDFHIDFGGSSVFYHILKGKKTFLFIPPKEKHLKKYEEWCMSPAQNWTFLGDQTKECYRVDLSEGDTMMIPAGWIHAVWTPEDSLVIGGNFLTRLDFGMQLRVAQVEKATGVARKFRYPHFQKLHWYTALSYLEDDPLPRKVKDLLHAGGTFVRQQPAYDEFDLWGENSRPGVENYHTRYYSQSELDGLPDLTRYLLRTALIDTGSIADGISAETRNAVKKSIPRGHGEPLDVLKTFAAWCAWKRGNEPIPHWAYPDAEPETLAPDKLSASAMKKLDQAAALQAPRRQPARMHSQQAASEVPLDSQGGATPLNARGQYNETHVDTPKKPRTSLGSTKGTSHRKTACETCRKRRRACKHKDQVALSSPTAQVDISESASTDLDTALRNSVSLLSSGQNDAHDSTLLTTSNSRTPEFNGGNLSLVREPSPTAQFTDASSYQTGDLPSHLDFSADGAVSTFTKIEESVAATIDVGLDSVSGNTMLVRPRHKACTECRKSKRRCIHDEYGNEDPVKVRESAIPRPHARKSNAQVKEVPTPKKHMQEPVRTGNVNEQQPVRTLPVFEEQMGRPAPIANMVARPASPMIQESGIPTLAEGFSQTSSAEPFPLDPALFEDGTNSIQHEEQTTVPVTLQQPIGPSAVSPDTSTKNLSEKVADQWEIIDSCPAPDIEIGAVTLESRENFEAPASSLVSPPASSHDDAGISPINAHAVWKSSAISSRHSSSQPKQMQRYTPESGSMRRASCSSYGEFAQEKAASPVIADLSSDQKSKARTSSECMADEESMRLIKELQAEEYGLRRRGRA